MLALRSPYEKNRQLFLPLYNKKIERNLASRLRHIFIEQDWEKLAKTFWIKQALDILFGIFVDSEPVVLAPNAASLTSLLGSQVLPERPGMLMSSSSMEALDSIEDNQGMISFVQLVNQHSRFLNSARKTKVKILKKTVPLTCEDFLLDGVLRHKLSIFTDD